MSRIAQTYRGCFTTLDGSRVLQDLTTQFYDAPDMASIDAHATVVKAAQRDVVRYILDMMEDDSE